MITIDNEEFDVGITKITRKASLNSINLGTTLNGTKHYEIKGTYYDYEVSFNVKAMNLQDYDTLYELITAPVEYHIVTLPYGQSTITFKAKTSISNDSLVFNYASMRKWGGFTVTFEALELQREVE